MAFAVRSSMAFAVRSRRASADCPGRIWPRGRDGPNCSDGWNRTSIDDVLGAVDRCGAIRDQERDQLGHLLGAVGAPDWNATQRIHQPLACGILVNPAFFG